MLQGMGRGVVVPGTAADGASGGEECSGMEGVDSTTPGGITTKIVAFVRRMSANVGCGYYSTQLPAPHCAALYGSVLICTYLY